MEDLPNGLSLTLVLWHVEVEPKEELAPVQNQSLNMVAKIVPVTKRMRRIVMITLAPVSDFGKYNVYYMESLIV